MIDRRSLLAFALLLPACGYRPKKPLAPPRVTMTGLRRENRQWLLKLRLQNLVDADMYLDRLQLEISIAGRQLRFDHGPPMNVLSALATDVIEQPISIDGATAAAIASATANSRSAAYALKGAAWTAEPKRRFDVEQEGFLSAVPGRPDEYR
ncbi:MAG: hypothetical protein KDI71_22465 [Xanthomonadales bacterium]|nr:hypothetical protein [Xanthomonadales bacterium]